MSLCHGQSPALHNRRLLMRFLFFGFFLCVIPLYVTDDPTFITLFETRSHTNTLSHPPTNRRVPCFNVVWRLKDVRLSRMCCSAIKIKSRIIYYFKCYEGLDTLPKICDFVLYGIMYYYYSSANFTQINFVFFEPA